MFTNIYCDESCHLEHDRSNCMVLGAISCDKEYVHAISKKLRSIKGKHGLSKNYELKWTKVSNDKIEYYKELIDLFNKNEQLHFRALVADKTQLRHSDFNQTHDDWYYKMYYLLLRYLVHPGNTYNVYLDIKDSKSNAKIQKLKEVLNHSLYDFYSETVQSIQTIRSHESELLQLADFMMGAVAYKNRNLSGSECKLELCRYLESSTSTSLISTTKRDDSKLNIFIWKTQ